MQTSLTEVLYLYRKVPILIYDNVVDPASHPVSHWLEGVDWEANNFIAERANYRPDQIKPKLIRWQDLSDADFHYIFGKVRPHFFEVVKEKALQGRTLMLNPFQYKRALEKYVDMYKLIDQGLAVHDKNPVK